MGRSARPVPRPDPDRFRPIRRIEPKAATREAHLHPLVIL
jgi:hypothetical protein